MPITSADIFFRRPLSVSDTTPSSNGGRMSANTAASGERGAIFPDVRNAERIAGSDRLRKVFVHFAPSSLSPAIDVRIVPYQPTPAGDCVVIYPGTHTDTQATFPVPVRAWGVGTSPALAAGATSITVTLEPGSPPIFAAGDTIYITDMATPDSTTGSEEYATVASVISGTGTQTLTLASGLMYAYTSPRVASVIRPGDVEATISGTAKTGAANTPVWTALQLVQANTVTDSWTLTVGSGGAVTVTSNAYGLTGTGSVTAGVTVNNPAFGGNAVLIPPSFFGGTWASGDSATWDTTAAAVPLWLRRIVPANTPSFAANSFTLLVDLESA
jgi:hypothetical protein